MQLLFLFYTALASFSASANDWLTNDEARSFCARYTHEQRIVLNCNEAIRVTRVGLPGEYEIRFQNNERFRFIARQAFDHFAFGYPLYTSEYGIGQRDSSGRRLDLRISGGVIGQRHADACRELSMRDRINSAYCANLPAIHRDDDLEVGVGVSVRVFRRRY